MTGQAENRLTDGSGRPIRYMRVSVTDRCNLRCRYCTPPEDFISLSHNQIITYEEIVHLAAILAPLGVSSVRITGGEPLVRKHLERLVRGLSSVPGVRDISLTTNGYFLADFAGPLQKAGLCRVNISLDTLQEERFTWITDPDGNDGPNGLKRVLGGIEAAAASGLFPVKINVVLMRGVNDDELEEFAALTKNHPYEVRFIEFMPMSPEGFWGPEKVIPASEAIGRLETVHGKLTHLGQGSGCGPAVRYQLPGYKGTIGFITPVSKHFCVECNRIRITSDGKLRTCLFSDSETDIIGPMRLGATDDDILSLVRDALGSKPKNHGMGEAEKVSVCARTMSHIGG